MLTLNVYGIVGEQNDMHGKSPTYNRDQYKLLKKCSEAKDTSSWNEWRKENRNEKIILKGANLSEFYLVDINLTSANLEGANLEKINLRGAQLIGSNLCKAKLKEANLEEAYLTESNLNDSDLTKANLKSAGLCVIKMQNATVNYANLENTDIQIAHLENSDFVATSFRYSNLNKTSLTKSNLKDSTFENAIAHKTDFKETDLTNVVFTGADFSHSNFWYAKYDIKEMIKAKKLFHAKFLLDNFDEYLFLKEKEILFCYEKQYKCLLECSERKDLTEWNDKNLWAGYYQGTKRIYLAGADFEKAFLEEARLWNADLREARFVGTNLKGAYLDNANLEGAYMNNSPCFDNAFLDRANLKNTDLGPATFRNARLFAANLENADLGCADFSGADLRRANLKNTKSILAANFEKALLEAANLEGANLYKCNFSGVDFHRGIVDGSTSMYQCQVNRETDFRCVSLDSIGIDSTTKRFLEYNIRRKNWNDWYWRTTWEHEKKIYVKYDSKKLTYEIMFRKIIRFIATLPVRSFWATSDYGTSPFRILKVFLATWFLFTLFYYKSPDCITNLAVSKGVSSSGPSKIQLFKRSAYFSASTMTTLGFVDMYPSPNSKGRSIVLLQVVIAYFLLGALITYLGILFTSGGPFLIYTFPHSGFP